jgi:hypothetical protein
MNELLSAEEKDRILMIAEGLIKQPESWVTSVWKCPAWENDGADLNPKQKEDENGAPLFRYCIEGAVNEATVRVVGEERAISLGAVRRDEDGELDYNGDWHDNQDGPTQILELDQLAYELYGDEMRGYDESEVQAMMINDELDDAHGAVLDILRTARKRLRLRR